MSDEEEAPTSFSFDGDPGFFALAAGNPPELGAGERVVDFTPPDRLIAPKLRHRIGMNTTLILAGTPLTHSTQQMLARDYGRKHIGFGQEAVTFICHWKFFAPGLFTVDNDGWVQEAPKKRRK